MSDTFDDLFGSSDDEQTTQLTTSSAPMGDGEQLQQQPEITQNQSQQPQSQPMKSEIDQMFPDSDDEDDIPHVRRKHTMDDDSDDDSFLFRHNTKPTTTPTTQTDQQQDSSSESLPSTSSKIMTDDFGTGALKGKVNTVPVGEPEHFYVKRPLENRSEIEKEFILLTIPKVVGTDYEAYDPETFDYTKVLSTLPPFQREYTQGIESMIRWKIIKDENGNDKRISNSRIVHWDNGDIHLQVGTQYFPLSVKSDKNTQQQNKENKEKGDKDHKEKSQDFLFLLSNGLYFHVGNIVTTWKTSIEPIQLSSYGPRMQAVKSRLIELEKDRKALHHSIKQEQLSK